MQELILSGRHMKKGSSQSPLPRYHHRYRLPSDEYRFLSNEILCQVLTLSKTRVALEAKSVPENHFLF